MLHRRPHFDGGAPRNTIFRTRTQAQPVLVLERSVVESVILFRLLCAFRLLPTATFPSVPRCSVVVPITTGERRGTLEQGNQNCATVVVAAVKSMETGAITGAADLATFGLRNPKKPRR
jgi:hypothetical protein